MTYPGYSYGPAGPEVAFTISSGSGTWNSANDWSFQNIDSAYTGGWGSHKYGGNIPMYEGSSNTKLCGAEPGGGGTTPQPTNTPTRTSTLTNPVNTNTPTRTNTRTNTPNVTNTRTPTLLAATLTPTRTLTPAITNTPTQIVGASPTRTPTQTVGASPTRTLTPVITNTPVVGTCSPVTSTITAPFTFDGAGTFCWQSSNLGAYVNSWNTTSVTLNGINVTNLYMASSSYPAKIGGFWYVSYNSTVAWGHFEAK